MKLSVVIPSYQDAPGLWYTVASCRVDLEADFAPDEYEIIGVVDGPEDDETRVILGMRQQNMCRIINVNTRTPQKNRHLGLLQAQAPVVFFLDSHVVLSRGYFKRMLQTIEESGAALVHSGHTFWTRGPRGTAYGYHLDWKDHFWAVTSEAEPQRSDSFYPICLAGHGAICVDVKQYLEVGGYWDALCGWGGEEPQLNLKLWLLGKRVLMEPRVFHWHYMPNKRNLHAIQLTPQFVKNFMLVAYASGGQKYLDAVYYFFTQFPNLADTVEEAMKKPFVAPFEPDYLEIPRSWGVEERERICAGPFHGDLDKLREYFTREGIPH